MIYTGDSLEVLPTLAPKSVHCCVTSPPYFGLRSYSGGTAEIGIEAKLDCVGWATGAKCGECFVCRLCAVFGGKVENDGVWRVLRDDGTLWVNLGDSYAADLNGRMSGPRTLRKGRHEEGSVKDIRGSVIGYNPSRDCKKQGLKHKDLCMVPHRFALAMQANGWYVRSDIVWSKPVPTPESVRDRPTKAHEYLFLMTKNVKYFYDYDSIKEKCVDGEYGATRNKKSVWVVNTNRCKEAHFATYPPALITPCIRAGCPVGGTVLDPFAGSGTTGIVAMREGREFIGIELNAEYAVMATRRVSAETPPFAELFMADTEASTVLA